MKLAQLIDPKFQAALKKLTDAPLPLKIAFKLKGTAKRIDEELAKYEEIRIKGLEKYGTRDSNGNLKTDERGSIQFEGDNIKLFVKELNELSSTEIEFEKISIDDLGDGVKLTIEEAVLLEDLLT